MLTDSQVPAATLEASEEAGADLGARSPSVLRKRLVSGSVTLLISSSLVACLNLVYNLAIAHGLGAGGFGHASVVYTLLLLFSSVALSFQLLCSKFVVTSRSLSSQVNVYRLLHRRAWMFGAGICALLALASPAISSYLKLPSRSYIVMLALAVLFYIPLGVRRGLMQGMFRFNQMAGSVTLEAVVKLGVALLLMKEGFAVSGVIAAATISVAAAYVFAMPSRQFTTPEKFRVPIAVGEGIQTSVFFVGQVIISNIDIVLVKHFFPPTEAGVYAAVALVGRIVYIMSWSIVSGMFPFSASAETDERDGRAVLGTALGLAAFMSSVFTLIVWLAPSGLWHHILGEGFPNDLRFPYGSLLALYAAATGIYSLSVVVMSYEISRRIGNVSWIQLGFSGVIVSGIYLFHNSLHQVIIVQLVLMTVLLAAVSIPFLRAPAPQTLIPVTIPVALASVRKVRRVPEEEVIAEFLRGEFYQREFNRYREPFHNLVANPDLKSARENALRRALLFRRRGRMWRELPSDTEWWQVELKYSDLDRIRVFPRSQWRKYADDSYYLLKVVERIRARVHANPSGKFLTKLKSLSGDFASGYERTSVLLIGEDENSLFTIIEGNHRMTAAALVSTSTVLSGFNFLCGFSPHMRECCWYQTDLSTLLKYAKNTVTYLLEDRKFIIEEALRSQMRA